VAQALNMMADVMQNMTRLEHREDYRAELEEDLALERLLKFHPPLFQGRPDSEREAETWIEPMEDIFTVLNYLD
jgi:hypothetical protein